MVDFTELYAVLCDWEDDVADYLDSLEEGTDLYVSVEEAFEHLYSCAEELAGLAPLITAMQQQQKEKR